MERQTIDNLAAYIKNWQTTIKGDKTIVVQAAGAAQRAVQRITFLGRPSNGLPTATSQHGYLHLPAVPDRPIQSAPLEHRQA